MQDEKHTEIRHFQKKVWIVVGVIAVTVILLWIFKATFNVFLLILAGVLIALYFHGLSNLIQRKLNLSKQWSLPIAIIGSFVLLALFFWLAGSKVNQQVQQLSQTLPSTIQQAKQQLNQSPIGQQVLQRISSGGNMQKASDSLKMFFSSTFGVLGDIYVVLFLGLFFTAAPQTYINGFIKLFPAQSRGRTNDIIFKVGHTLTKWLKGQLFAMLVVAVLTTIGLLTIGVPMAFILALIAGILNFIPNFGPLIAMIPAVLVGLLQGPNVALMVIGLYVVVQVLESNLITPQIQKRMIEIPPALIILSQLFMGVLTGGWGLVLATPIVAILMVVIQELWVKKQDAKS